MFLVLSYGDAASNYPRASNNRFGMAMCDGTSVMCPDGILRTTPGNVAAGNPTAVAGPAAVNGSASTFMRSDAAPAIRLGTNSQTGLLQADGVTTSVNSPGIVSVPIGSASQFGLMECDNSTVKCPSGVLSAASPSFYNVKQGGAVKGDGATDDTAAIAAANAAASSAGQALFFPAGTYCVKTGPITVSTNGTTWQGVNREVTILSACGADSQILVDNAFHDMYSGIYFRGSAVPGTTKDNITLNAAGFGGYSEVTIVECGADGGRYAIKSSSGEQYLYNNKLQSHYGPATIYLQNNAVSSGGYILRNKMDQPWPAGAPNFGSISLPIQPWQPSHAYTSKQSMVTVSAAGTSYTLQAMTNGTSGTSTPVVPSYGVTVNDGSTSWQLAKPTNYNGVQCDTNCGGILYIDYNDFSSTYDNGIAITNTLGGNNPYGIYISNNTFGSLLDNNILVSAGNVIHIVNNQFGAGVGTPFTDVSITGLASDLSIIGGEMGSGIGALSGSTGVFVGTSGGVIIMGTHIAAVQTAISIGANVSNVTAVGNKLGGAPSFGNNGEGVFIAAGVSDYIHLTSNDYAGAGVPINDTRSAQGNHDLIQYDIHGVNCGVPSASFAVTGGLVTHC